ncbi:MAG: alpha-glucuronidase [Sphingobacteriaceae bacterium]|nr:MAG: alpha-glucuronidase [Sphingobacteriaceae bacterium]
MKKLVFYLLLVAGCTMQAFAEDGYRLWLRYDKITDKALYNQYRQSITQLVFPGNSETLQAAQKELGMGLNGLLQLELPLEANATKSGALIVGTPATSKIIAGLNLAAALKAAGNEGYIIRTVTLKGKPARVIAANTDIGVMYGVFNFLKLLQTEKSIKTLAIVDAPKIKTRINNHWDNLNGSVERGYGGQSLWNWAKLPEIEQRYIDYARANASLGINGTVLTNVNANAQILTKDYLVKVAALAKAFRPYGIKVYLTARFSAPIELKATTTADPLDQSVQQWWNNKAIEIYQLIPDFGGFLVKANSEGQPGPQNYGRGHVEGANMFADALAPHGGIVMWRAFVYDEKVADDRTKQAYNEFKPLDGKFKKNVFVQVKNGPLDFQPREPFSPLFGAMPKTPQMMEFQVTKEYLGWATNLVYLAPMWKETLESDTYAKGKGSTVAKVITGQLDGHTQSGIAGVTNIGNDINWCGNHLSQANWYAYGRLAWNPDLSSAGIADEWLRMTFNNDKTFIEPVKQIMLTSRETAVNYMTPLGLTHIMSRGHHYGPGPWVTGGRADQTSLYFHKADAVGIGFDRTSKTGSNAVGQYNSPLREMWDNIATTPEKDLLWFHHVPWDYKMKSGKTLWIELIEHYNKGIEGVKQMQKVWNAMEGKIDAERFKDQQRALAIQLEDAELWKGACLTYFQTFSKMPIPAELGVPKHDLDYYQKLRVTSDKRKLEGEQ